MKSNLFALTLTATLFGAAAMASAQFGNVGGDSEVVRLRREIASLSSSLVAANTREAESSRKLKEIESRLAAMGTGILGGGEDRLVKAVSDLEVMTRKLKAMEDGILAFIHLEFLDLAWHHQLEKLFCTFVSRLAVDINGINVSRNNVAYRANDDIAFLIDIDRRTFIGNSFYQNFP